MLRYENTILPKILAVVFAIAVVIVPQTALGASAISVGARELAPASWVGSDNWSILSPYAGTGNSSYDQMVWAVILYDDGSADWQPQGAGPLVDFDSWGSYSSPSSGAYIFSAGHKVVAQPYAVNNHASSMEGAPWPDGTYRVFIVKPDGTGPAGLGFDGVDWGGATYPTYSAAMGTSAYYWDITIASAVATAGTPVPDPEDGVFPAQPETGEEYGSPVLFSGHYTNGVTGAYDQMIFAVSDLTDSNSQSYTFPIFMGSIEMEAYAFSIPLALNHSYEYQAWLRDSSTGDISDVTDFFAFDTIPGTVPSPQLPDEVCTPTEVLGIPIPAFGCEIRNALKWAFVPTPESLTQFANISVADRAPFVYLYQLPTVVSYLWDTDTVTPLVMTTMPINGETLTFFSKETLENTPFIGTVRGFIEIAIYVMTAIALYHMARRFH